MNEKIDWIKKYEGLGLSLEYETVGGFWVGEDRNCNNITIDEPIVQAWLDAGLIKPVKQTKIVRVEGVRMVKPPSGNLYSEFRPTHYDELPDGAMSRPVTLEFEVEE